MKKKKFAQVRHAFLYKYLDAAGKEHVIKAWAKVRLPSRAVAITLKSEHVERSMELGGIGHTATCSMAVCGTEHADQFPHHVEGHIDWTYTRAYVVSKVDRETGLPTECYVYEHNDSVAQLNDSAAGQMKLLKKLREDGPRTITLSPYRVRSAVGRPGKGRKKTGARDTEQRLRGGKLRYAVAKLASEQPEAV